MTRDLRIDEREALDVIRALEKVERHEWLSEGAGPTPDLEVTIGGEIVTVEVTMHTSKVGREWWAAAKKMRSPERSGEWPQKTNELTNRWRVIVSDHRLEERDDSLSLKALVQELIPALAEVERSGGSPEVMQRRANEMLSPDPYDPNTFNPNTRWIDEWALRQDAEGEVEFDEYVNTGVYQRCDYWLPRDLADWITKGMDPRRVRVVEPPTVLAGEDGGVVVADVWFPQSCWMEAVDELVPAIQDAINHKAAKCQMANVTGEKWLVVALDGGNAAMQLDELCNAEGHPQDSALSSITFPDFNEVWAFARTFHGTHHVVLRLSRSELTPRCFKVPRPVNEAQV